MKTTYSDGPYRTFQEKSDVTLAVDTMVTFHTDGTVKAATAGSVLGWNQGRLIAGQKELNIRLLGKGGTVRAIQSETIALGALVMQDSAAPTKVKTYAAGGLLLGVKAGPNAGAASDVIEIVDFATGSSDFAGQALAALVDEGAVIAALTSSSTTTQAEFNALRDACEDVADQVLTIEAALRAAGILTTP